MTQQPLFNHDTEQGEASLKISLKEGEIIVNHGTDGDELYRAKLNVGGWNAIWAAIYGNSFKPAEEKADV